MFPPLRSLLESGDISSVLTRSEMVKCVSKQDNATLDTLMKKMQEIQNEKQAMEKDKLKLEEDKKTLTQRKADLQASINDYNSSKQELDAEVSKANSAIKSLKSDKAEMQEAISANENEIKQIDADISAALNSSDANKPGNNNYTPVRASLVIPQAITLYLRDILITAAADTTAALIFRARSAQQFMRRIPALLLLQKALITAMVIISL